MPMLATLKQYHTLLVPIFVATILLQICAARFVREITEEEAAAVQTNAQAKAKSAAEAKVAKEKSAKDSVASKEEKAKRQQLRKEQAERTQRRLEKAEKKIAKKDNKKEQDMWNTGKADAKKGRGRR